MLGQHNRQAQRLATSETAILQSDPKARRTRLHTISAAEIIVGRAGKKRDGERADVGAGCREQIAAEKRFRHSDGMICCISAITYERL
jgi:hypothetical protein